MSATPIIVRTLAPGDEARWDDFVARCPEATFFHSAGWRSVIERVFGHRTYYLIAERRGAVCGVLPLTYVRSALFGKALVSNAFAVYGGAAADDDASHAALDAHAEQVARMLGVAHLEYRARASRHPDWAQKSDLYATFRRAIGPDPDKEMLAIPRKQRAMVRKGIKAGLVSEIDADVTRLHRVYAESVRNLGTPVFPRAYFAALKEAFGDACEVLTVSDGARAVASVMSFYFRNEVLPYYGGGTAQARACAANDFMYWEVLRRASLRGVGVFDFGRSKRDTGAFAFKHNWGFEPEPLHYEYRLVRGREVPDINPLNPKFRLFIGLWRRLPLGVANVLGPRIVRGLG